MFRFLRNAASHQPSLALQRALVQQVLPLGLSVDALRVLTTHGRYAGRSVRYFRTFDPRQALQRDMGVRRFKDLDAHPELVVGSGHVEDGGAVSLTRRVTARTAPTLIRERADRAGHLDDEHLVFWNAAASRSSAVHFSEAAASWRHASSTRSATSTLNVPALQRE